MAGSVSNDEATATKRWRMVKSETRRDAETLAKNPSPRLFGKKFRDSKKVETNHPKTRLRDFSKMLPRFRDPVKIFPRPTFFKVPFATPQQERQKQTSNRFNVQNTTQRDATKDDDFIFLFQNLDVVPKNTNPGKYTVI